MTDSGRAATGHVLSTAGIVVAAPFLAMTTALALFVAVVAALVVLAMVLWLVRLVTSPQAALASARQVFRRPPTDDAA